MPVQAIPEGYHTVTPYLVVKGAAKTIDFAQKAFGAELAFEPMTTPQGKIMHAEMRIDDPRVMISDSNEQHPPMPSMLHLYVPNVDAVYQNALKAGGAAVKDSAGVAWYIATHTEDVPAPELKKRAEAHMKETARAN